MTKNNNIQKSEYTSKLMASSDRLFFDEDENKFTR